MGDDSKPTAVERRGSNPPERTSQPAQVVREGRYESGEEIARGGMGRVVEARDTLLDRVVAVKEALTSDPDSLRRFARETRITARLEHPSIVPVYDAGTAGESPFYVMRRVSGRPLEDLVCQRADLTNRLALVPHMLACAQAVAHAHQRGIIHRDIKPTNILVGELGETMVIDWGLAKVIGERDDDADDARQPFAGDSLRTRIGVVAGTPGFMSPEQARGEPAGPPSDVYALGATLYYLLARRPPHHADDADEIIRLTALRAPAQIASLVPGVPNELAAIVDKALAFAPEDRYPDAAALAEDLQRFLTGQLVASHRYTRRERLVRFVRRHRAAVAIGIAAMIVVAAVSTFAIGSVLSERDRADDQARLAIEGRREAELARTREQVRADSELVSRARAIVETRPTAALAALKLLPPTSSKRAEAQDIARTALMRGGAAWALQARESHPTIVQLEPSRPRLLIVYRSGDLELWDLERRRRTFHRQFAEGTRASWIDNGGRLLLYHGTPTSVLDATTGVITELGLPRLEDVVASASGSAIAAIDEHRVAGWLDVSAQVFQPLWPGHHARQIAMPENGSWIAAADKHGVSVWDRSGTQLTTFTGGDPVITASVSQRLAVQSQSDIFETVVGPGSTWRKIDLSKGLVRRGELAHIAYDRELLFGRGIGRMISLHTAQPFEWMQVPGSARSPMESIGSQQMITVLDDAHLLLFDRVHSLRIPLPEARGTTRLTARRGHSQAVLVGGGMIQVLDLSRLLPRRLPIESSSRMVVANDTSLLVQEHALDGWAWLDLETGRRTPIPLPDGFTTVMATDQENRVLFGDTGVGPWTPPDPTLLPRFTVVTQGRDGQQSAVDPAGVRPMLIAGDAVVYASATAVYAAIGDEPFRRLGALAEPARFVVRAGYRRAAIVTDTSLLIADVAKGTLERIEVEVPKGAIVAEYRGRLVMSDGATLRWWEPGGAQIAKFEAPIQSLYPTTEGVLVELHGSNWLFVELEPSVRIHRIGPDVLAVNRGGSRLLSRSASGLEIIDLPARSRWGITIPVTSSSTVLTLTPDGLKIIERPLGGSVWEWTLPPVLDDLASELDEMTNATENEDGLLTWPWQATATSSPSPSRTAP